MDLEGCQGWAESQHPGAEKSAGWEIRPFSELGRRELRLSGQIDLTKAVG